jgi:3-oxoacyl-[acyl-carrier protein] reductase
VLAGLASASTPNSVRAVYDPATLAEAKGLLGMSADQLKGQVALVTGASRGIGAAIARELAAARHEGDRHGHHRRRRGQDHAALQPLGCGRASTSTTPAGVEALIDAIAKEHGGLQVLVNNAGITRDMLAMRMKDDDWDAVLDTNLKAVFRMSRAVMRTMMKQRYGRIVSITSVVGASGNPGQANYAAAKAGVAGMTRALARELGSRGITVNCVAPGFIETDMTAALPEEQQKALLGQIPLGHLGKSRTTSPTRSPTWPRRRPVTSPGRNCTSTAACTWPEPRNGGLLRLPSPREPPAA